MGGDGEEQLAACARRAFANAVVAQGIVGREQCNRPAQAELRYDERRAHRGVVERTDSRAPARSRDAGSGVRLLRADPRWRGDGGSRESALDSADAVEAIESR